MPFNRATYMPFNRLFILPQPPTTWKLQLSKSPLRTSMVTVLTIRPHSTEKSGSKRSFLEQRLSLDAVEPCGVQAITLTTQ